VHGNKNVLIHYQGVSGSGTFEVIRRNVRLLQAQRRAVSVVQLFIRNRYPIMSAHGRNSSESCIHVHIYVCILLKLIKLQYRRAAEFYLYSTVTFNCWIVVLFFVRLTIFFNVFIDEKFFFLFPTSVHTAFNYMCVCVCVCMRGESAFIA
jgi:hypothetical protein